MAEKSTQEVIDLCEAHLKEALAEVSHYQERGEAGFHGISENIARAEGEVAAYRRLIRELRG